MWTHNGWWFSAGKGPRRRTVLTVDVAWLGTVNYRVMNVGVRDAVIRTYHAGPVES